MKPFDLAIHWFWCGFGATTGVLVACAMNELIVNMARSVAVFVFNNFL